MEPENQISRIVWIVYGPFHSNRLKARRCHQCDWEVLIRRYDDMTPFLGTLMPRWGALLESEL